MVFISHRGNLFGASDSTKENNLLSATRALDLGFDVELDFWGLNESKQLMFGHDFPQHDIELEFLMDNKPHIWIHAKNGEALQFALNHKLRCFFHQNDDYTLVSNNCIWRYPKAGLEVTIDTIVVLPERDPTVPIYANRGRGYCTDFPILLRFALSSPDPDTIWAQGLKLDTTYAEIASRPLLDFTNYDTFPNPDQRRCIAAFSDFEPNETLDKVLEASRGWGLTYSPNSPDARMHFTHMQVSDFAHCATSGISEESLQFFKDTIGQHDQQTKFIEFHRVLLFPNCIALVGYPSWDVMGWRATIREKCETHPHFHEPHAQNIVHSTLVRFTHPVKPVYLKEVLESIQAMLPVKLALGPRRVSVCSWKMGKEISRE
jgi:hypothetical protein